MRIESVNFLFVISYMSYDIAKLIYVKEDPVDAENVATFVIDTANWKQPQTDEDIVRITTFIASLPKTALSRFSAFPHLRLRPSLRHGDFAPWNLLPCPNGGLKVVDWESGHREDVPGFDLVHYLLQEEFLVHRSAFPAAQGRILQRMHAPLAAEYLTASGWGGVEDILWELALAHESSTRKEIADWVSSALGRR